MIVDERIVVGAIVLAGLEPGAWRPVDPTLARIVDAAVVHGVDHVGVLAEALRDLDCETEWSVLLIDLMEAASEWSCRMEGQVSAARRAKRTDRAARDLHAALDDLERARVGAERAYAVLTRALDEEEIALRDHSRRLAA